MKRMVIFFPMIALIAASEMKGQDSVDIVFRYNSPSSPAMYLVGEFNGWNNSATPMQFIGNNTWIKTYRLAVGGNPNAPAVGVPGAWQYKFYYSGASPWPDDPLNHHQNGQDNNNTFIYTKDPTMYHLLPNQRQLKVKTALPVISAYIFPKVSAFIDTASITVTIDGTSYNNIGAYYDVPTKQLSFPVPTSLRNGNHTVILSASSSAGGTNADTVNFAVQAGFVQITSQGGFATRNPVRLIRGIVQDTSIHVAKIIHNVSDTTAVSITNGSFSLSDTLMEGLNTYKAIVDSNGIIISSDPVVFTYVVNHTPYALASVVSVSGAQLTLDASSSVHPNGRAMTFKWLDTQETPLGLNGQAGSQIVITTPSAPGEYYFTLIASDSSGAADTAHFYFIMKNDGQYENPLYASNPEWAKRARVYFLFPKAFTSEGTIPAATQRLKYVADMGFNVIWVMPVMKNAYPIDQNYGPGYNIIDFYNVAPEYGTNQDFKNFVSQAHSLGLKVILDVTPNHTSRFHPWSQDAHLFKQDSRYWNWYEHTIISHNDNGLGQSLDADGFNYYSGFSDQLLNYNWRDIDAQAEMINAYKYWIKEFNLDGYRFDVYWGPHRRYGEKYMGQPVREALKHIKPDILLLAEDDGTGVGTETIYADYVNGNVRGGVDAAYDFKAYFNQIRNFSFSSSAITNLHNELSNGGYFPGPNSLYMRFMESQDEDRIFYNNPSATTYYDADPTTAFYKTKPMATAVFSAPGFPMIWNGQEVGWGYGISGAKEKRNRSTISWNFQGKEILTSHYQRLAWIRGAFPAFNTQAFSRIETNQSLVYGILRPYQNENAISLCNFGNSPSAVSLNLIAAGTPNILLSNPQDGKTYYVSNVYSDTTYEISFSGGSTVFTINLPAYGSAVLVVSDTAKKISFPTITSVGIIPDKNVPAEYLLKQNYPNPFNPSTTIQFSIPQSEMVTLKVFDALGREVATIVNERMEAGAFSVSFNASSLASGMYFYKLTAGKYSQVKKMTLLK